MIQYLDLYTEIILQNVVVKMAKTAILCMLLSPIIYQQVSMPLQFECFRELQ